MGKTSNEAKQRYKNKVYKTFQTVIKKEEYNQVEKIIKEKEISKAEFVRQAIKKFEDEKGD